MGLSSLSRMSSNSTSSSSIDRKRGFESVQSRQFLKALPQAYFCPLLSEVTDRDRHLVQLSKTIVDKLQDYHR